MTRRYTGGFISAKEQATDSNTANGVFTLAEAQEKTALGNFPTGRWTPQRSLRIRASASAGLSRTFGTPTSAYKWTWSAWVKRGLLSSNLNYPNLFGAGTSAADQIVLASVSSIDCLNMNLNNASGGYFVTTQVFRDTSAWYHIIVAVDTTQAIASNRMLVYVNGVAVTSFSQVSYPTQNSATIINSATGHYLGRDGNATRYFDGYLSEVNFIDGQQLDPTYFGATDPETGTWIPKRYTGTYGNNGFYLDFRDNSAVTAATIGADRSGNGNNWTPNNISVTAGATYDSMVDVPGIAAVSSQTEVGGVTRGNYATWNPVSYAGNVTYSNGNLTAFSSVNSIKTALGTISADTSNKWYFEQTITSLSDSYRMYLGFVSPDGWRPDETAGTYIYTVPGFVATWNVGNTTATYYTSGYLGSAGGDISTGTYSDSKALNDVYMFAYDGTTGKFWFGKNGTWWVGNPNNGTNPIGILKQQFNYTPAVSLNVTGAGNASTLNCGQRPFSYTPPTGFKSICTTNLSNPVIKRPDQHFQAVTHTGNNRALTIGAAGQGTPLFQSSVKQISKSARFISARPNYFRKIPVTAGNTQKFTWSGWVKQGHWSGSGMFMSAGDSSNRSIFGTYGANNVFTFLHYSSYAINFSTNTGYPDPTRWYHFVLAVDTTQPNGTQGVKLWVDGVQQTSWSSSAYTQNTNLFFNSSSYNHYLGQNADGNQVFTGSMADVYWIDGQQLDATNFGMFDPNGNWCPITYTGTYGTNGFYLDYSDSSSVNGGSGTSWSNVTYGVGLGGWTTLNKSQPIANNAVVDSIGVWQNSSESGKYVYIVRSDGGSNYTIVAQSASFTHVGNALQWVQLTSQYTVPATGTYYMAVYCPGSGLNWGHDTGGSTTWTYYVGNPGAGSIAYTTGAQSYYEPALYYRSNSKGLSADKSGSNNHWWGWNFSVAAGIENDSLTDVPTDWSSTNDAIDDGGETRGNYCTLNPSSTNTSSPAGTAYAMYQYYNTSATSAWGVGGTMAIPKNSGKYYWEYILSSGVSSSAGGIPRVGTMKSDYLGGNYPGAGGGFGYTNVGGFGVNAYDGTTVTEGISGPTLGAFTTNDVMGIAYDSYTGRWYVRKNGTWLNSGDPVAGTGYCGVIGLLDQPITPMINSYNSVNVHCNFGQRPYANSAPAGYKSLNTKSMKDQGGYNLPNTYGTLLNTPDIVWTKNRVNGNNWSAFDTILGPGYSYSTSTTDTRYNQGSTAVQAFTPGGVTFGPDNSSTGSSNGNNWNYISYMWNKGVLPGIDIVNYSGTGAATQIKHNLGQKPAMIIVFVTNQVTAAARNKAVYHRELGSTQGLYLQAAAAAGTETGYWNSTDPDSQYFTVGGNNDVNGTNQSYTAYLFAEVPGFSKFGKYTGNSSTEGPFIYTGFRPKLVWIKRTTNVPAATGSQAWNMTDTTRSPYNPISVAVWNNDPSIEGSGTGYNLDILSNGFKLRNTTYETNDSSNSYVYMCFAESPFKYANAR